MGIPLAETDAPRAARASPCAACGKPSEWDHWLGRVCGACMHSWLGDERFAGSLTPAEYVERSKAWAAERRRP
jgi:hypothetical protein